MKRAVIRCLNPLDWIVRRINAKQDLPPLHLRWEVGPLRGYERSAAEYRIILQLYGGWRPDSRVLDIGCGCGQIAGELLGRLEDRGTYEGWDINAEAIRWCERAITTKSDRFAFRVLNVRNGLYNPSGGEDGATFRFPAAGPFDLILLKSVFTHLLRDEMINYAQQLGGLLEDRGRCVVSCFLLNDRQRDFARMERNLIRFCPFRDGMSVANPAVPEAIVAYEEAEIRAILQRARLRLARPILQGGWIGDPAALSHQDILVLERET